MYNVLLGGQTVIGWTDDALLSSRTYCRPGHSTEFKLDFHLQYRYHA